MDDKQASNLQIVNPYWFEEIQKKIKRRKRRLKAKDRN